MKHAGSQAIEALDALLVELRRLPGMRERKPGVFYRKEKAFLHFHEDPAGLFADVRTDGAAFERFCINSDPERRHLVQVVRRALEA